MCRTCDYKQYQPISERGVLIYEKSICGNSIIIRYHPSDKSYWISPADNPENNIPMFCCICCGRELWF